MSKSPDDVYADCPAVTVTIWRHDAKSGACPHCEAMDGEYYVTPDNADEPYPIKQHDYCRCDWEDQEVEGLTEATVEELKNQHAEIVKEIDDAEAQVEFRRMDMEEYKAKEQEYLDEETKQKGLALEYVGQADRLQELIDEIQAKFGDELPQDAQDEIDAMVEKAAAYLSMAEDAEKAAQDANDNAQEARDSWRWHEGEMDAAEKLVAIWTEKLLEVEPCLAYPSLEYKIYEICGSRAHFLN